MDDLHKALGDIRSIRRQVAQTTEFRGYGPATLACTAGIAVLAAGLQSAWLHDPVNHIERYLSIWVAAALLSATLSGIQMYNRSRRIHSGLSDEMIGMAIEQFLPVVGAGLLVTLVILYDVPSATWLLPGLWQLLFSLGVFSSCRFLPPAMRAAGAWYLLAALLVISYGDSRALSPWAMGIPYGVGQLLIAGVLFFKARDQQEDQ
jgi:hypothetical protein